jgi:glycosyltransferase involved in cell wall biosynthesis
MVVTEALARGIPVLATDAGGVVEALGDGPGLLVPPGDPAALASVLRRWFTEPALREDLRAAARARRDALTGWEVTTRSLSRVLDRLPA